MPQSPHQQPTNTGFLENLKSVLSIWGPSLHSRNDLYEFQMALFLLNSCPPFQSTTIREQLKLHITAFINYFTN